MTEQAIVETTRALQSLIEQAIGIVEPKGVHIGAPIRDERRGMAVSLFLFHIEPNGELRNEERFEEPAAGGLATRPLDNTLPLNLRYLITVFREGDAGTADPNELMMLGQIIQALHAHPTLSGSQLTNQVVRLTPEPYPMEEMSRIWGLFPNEVYRTSMVYLATPVYVDVIDRRDVPPVLSRTNKTGIMSDFPENQTEVEGAL
jgi:hypothetical protein